MQSDEIEEDAMFRAVARSEHPIARSLASKGNASVTRPFVPPSAEVLAELKAMSERQLSAEEFAALEAIPISEDERQATLALIEWFTRRYPTGQDRLRYVRRAYAAWKRQAIAAP